MNANYQKQFFWFHIISLVGTGAQVFLPASLIDQDTPQQVIDRAYILNPEHRHKIGLVAAGGQSGIYPV